MPAFGARSTEENIWRVVAYLKEFAPSGMERVDGDPARGAGIFWGQGGCGGCHRVGRRGGAFGPDLTRIGRSRNFDYLQAALTEPDRDLPPGYYVVEVVTNDGRTIRGLGLGLDDFSAQLRDAAGRLHSFLRSEVRSIERQFASLMPEYGESLADGQRQDLLAYLQSLRGEEDSGR